jgi:hypothetical protein
MIKIIKNTLLFSFLTLTMLNCAQQGAFINSKLTSNKPSKIFVASTIIGPIPQPILPLLDAAAFNSKTNKLASELNNLFLAEVNGFQDTLLIKLNKAFNTEFDLIDTVKYPMKASFVVFKAEGVKNETFPFAYFADNDINIVDLKDGKDLERIFLQARQQTTISSNLKKVGVPNALIVFNRINVIGAGMFGINGTIRFETYMFLYDENGNLILDTKAFSAPTSISGNNITEYHLVMKKMPELIDQTIEKLKTVLN